MPPPMPLSGAGSWSSCGSQSRLASSVANEGSIDAQASLGDAARAIVARAPAMKRGTVSPSTSSSSAGRAQCSASPVRRASSTSMRTPNSDAPEPT